MESSHLCTQTPPHTHNYEAYYTHRVGQIDPRHTMFVNQHTHPHPHSALNSISPVKLLKLLFLILPFKSKARRVIHNLRIFSLLLPNANGNPCSTNGLLNSSEKKLSPLISFPAECRTGISSVAGAQDDPAML